MAEGGITEIEAVLKIRDEASSAVAAMGEAAQSTLKIVEDLDKKLKFPSAKLGADGMKGAGEAAHNGAGGIHGLGEAFEGVREKGFELKRELFELAAAVGVATTIKGFVEKLIDTNAEAEESTRSLGATIAGMYQYGKLDPAENFREGVKRSSEMVEHFGEVAFATGISKGSLIKAAADMTPAFAGAGRSTEDLTVFTENLGVVARATGEGVESAAQQIRMAVEFGGARRSKLLSQLGIQNKQLQGLNKKQRLDLITKRLAAMRPSDIAQMRTYGDLVARVRAQVDAVMEAGGKPLFEAAKKTVEELGTWIEKNRGTIEETVGLIAYNLKAGLNDAVDLVKTIVKYWDEVKVIVETVAAMWAAHKAGSATERLIGGLRTAFKKGGEAAGESAITGFVRAGEEAGEAAGSTMGLAAKASIVVATGIAAYELTKVGEKWLSKNWSAYNKAATPSRTEEDKAAWKYGERKQMEAVERRGELDKWLASATESQQLQVEILKTQLQHAEEIGAQGFIIPDSKNNQYAYTGDIRAALRARGFDTGPTPGQTAVGAGDKKLGVAGTPAEGAKTQMIFPNARFDITQNFAEGFDPDRIIAAFGTDLAQLGETKVSSGLMPLGAAF